LRALPSRSISTPSTASQSISCSSCLRPKGPAPITIDGYAGQELEIQLPDDPFTDCDVEPGDSSGHAYVFPISVYVQGPANIWNLSVLDVEGTPLIAAILSYQKTPQAELDDARNAVATMDIQV